MVVAQDREDEDEGEDEGNGEKDENEDEVGMNVETDENRMQGVESIIVGNDIWRDNPHTKSYETLVPNLLETAGTSPFREGGGEAIRPSIRYTAASTWE